MLNKNYWESSDPILGFHRFLHILYAGAIFASLPGLRETLQRESFNLSITYLFDVWALPFVFYITLIRFYIGNISHIEKVRVYIESSKKSRILWVIDFIIFVLQAILFVILGYYSFEDKFLSFWLLAGLCFIDVFWISLIWLMDKCKIMWRRPEGGIPTKWAEINFINGSLLVLLLHYFPFPENKNIILLVTLFNFSYAFARDIAYQIYFFKSGDKRNMQ